MTDRIVEAATTEDAETVTSLWVELATDQRGHDAHILPAENRERIRESIVRHIVADTLLVARDEETVGFVMFTVENGSYRQDTERGIVENLYVAPGARNEGVGTALLEGAERRLQERGVDAVALEVLAKNEAARRFYRRRGYDPRRVELEKPLESDTHSKDGG